MSYCPKCQCTVYGILCLRCGGVPAEQSPAEIETDQPLVAARCYGYGPVGAAYFLRSPIHQRSLLVRFHAWQSILLWTSVAVYYAIAYVVREWLTTHSFPHGEGYLIDFVIVLLSRALVPALAVSALVASFVAAQRGDWNKLPLLGDLATLLAARGSLPPTQI